MKKSFVETTAKKFSSPYGEKVLELGTITDTWDPGIQFSSPYGEKVLELKRKKSIERLRLSFRPLTGNKFWN